MRPLAIFARSMFDGLTAHGPTTIQILDGQIIAIESGRRTARGAESVDLGPSSFVLPGLIDCHVHLAFDAGPAPVTTMTASSDAELLDQMRRSARNALAVGITTVRDLGDRGYLCRKLAAELDSDPAAGPDVLAAGPPITTPGGHCHFMGGGTSGLLALRTAVRHRYEQGCAVIKVMASGGTMTPGSAPHLSQYSRTELRAVVAEAHKLGLPVAAHAHGTAAIADAVAADVDSIEHVTFLGASASGPSPALKADIAASGVAVSLTLGVLPGTEQLVPDNMRRQLEAAAPIYRELHDLGAEIVVGTDAGIGEFKPHNVLPHALPDLIALGFSPLEALSTITHRAAQVCGLSSHKGRIAVGADADLLVVEGDPLTDVAALTAVAAVFRRGVQVR